ncbi:hypothetical protein C500_14710 [Natrialba magadii ATCC 43099]|nr:CARDB domain-containing protein [Natrialba magadii]ELY27098.1 hypothetical protein C500_14710 [Natrialba magadii ATCC 43099]
MSHRSVFLAACIGILVVCCAIALVPAGVSATDDDTPDPDEYDSLVDGMDGNGTADDPFHVTNVTELQAMEANLSAHYKLVSPIDASETADWNDGDGFDPIGACDFNATIDECEETPFEGSFDGGLYPIADLTIDRENESEVGLFGYVFPDGEVVDIKLRDARVTGNVEVGTVTGLNFGSIEGADVTGTTSGDLDAFPGRIGGLAGYNGGEVRDSFVDNDVIGPSFTGGAVGSNNGTIVQTHASGDVEALDISGGLVGTNVGDGEVGHSTASGDVNGTFSGFGGFVGTHVAGEGIIYESYATGDVSGETISAAGGFAGSNSALTGEAVIYDAYATGNVNGEDRLGGFVGDLGSSAFVEMSYATGSVSGAPDEASVGGFAGNVPDRDAVAITGSYYDEVTSQQDEGIGVGDGDVTGLPTQNMTDDAAAENMTAFDFAAIWTTLPDDYPTLQALDPEPMPPDPPNFAVTIDETTSPVTEGSPLNVNTTIENVGEQATEQTVSLEVAGDQRDVTTVALGGDEYETVVLTWETEVNAAGDYDATVSSDDDSETVPITVEEQPDDAVFDVTIDETNSPVTEGGNLLVNATVENTGNLADEQDVNLTINGDEVDATVVSLDGDETEEITFTWETEENDADDYDATVSSDDNSETVPITVEEQPDDAFFDVTIDETSSPVTEGEELEVGATIENTGDLADEQDIKLSINDSEMDVTTVDLDGNETEEVTLIWETEKSEAGDYVANISSNNDLDMANVSVGEKPDPPTPTPPTPDPAFFDVTVDNTTSPVTEGEKLLVNATIENTGDRSDKQDINLTINGNEVNVTSIELDSDESEKVTLTWETEKSNTGEYVVTVSTKDNTDMENVTVNAIKPAFFTVDIKEVTDSVHINEEVCEKAYITNVGEEVDTQNVVLDIDKQEGVDSTTVTLKPSKSQKVTLCHEWITADADKDVPMTVRSDNSAETVSVSIIGSEPVKEDDDEETEPDVLDDDETADGTPGFGVVGTLIVVLMAVALAHRRR